MLASAKQGQRDGSGLKLLLAAMAGGIVVFGIGALIDVDWGWGRQSLSVAGVILAVAGIPGTTIVFLLVRDTKRDRAAVDQLTKENEDLARRAQRALAQREAGNPNDS